MKIKILKLLKKIVMKNEVFGLGPIPNKKYNRYIY